MKITRMVCENCGKEFYTEYYDGGYIDHMNMVNNFQVSLNRGLDSIVDDICKSGNSWRPVSDIDIRKTCFIKWLEKQDVSKEFIERVINQVDKTQEHISEIETKTEKLQNQLNELDWIDRKYIIDNLFD